MNTASMGSVTALNAQRKSLLDARLGRLAAAVCAGSTPIVWARGVAGAGKTELLRSLSRSDLCVLDNPTPAELRATLAAQPRRLLVAARPNGELDQELLAKRLYGQVALIEDRELFCTAAELGDATLAAVTGGWPVLVKAQLEGRAEEVCALLPEFLQREVLPTLPVELTTALFAAVAEPLSRAAAESLFGGVERLHPFLRCADEQIHIASSWVAAALQKLRARPRTIPEPVLARLAELHSAFGDPVRSIKALNAIGCPEQALAVFERAGGLFFGFRHGFTACAEVLRSFAAEFENRCESLQLARQFLYFKTGQSREALRRLDANFPRLPVDLRSMEASHRVHALLLRLDIATDLDEPVAVDVVRSWGRLESCLDPDDHLTRGVLYNTMTLAFIRVDELYQARQLAEDALAAYQRAGSPYLAHFMRVHLADIAIRQSRLSEAAEYLERAQAELDESGLVYNSETAILEMFRARLAYEQGRMADCPFDAERLFAALEQGDSWPDLIRTIMSYAPLVSFWRDGFRAALDTVEHCLLTLGRRHGTTGVRTLEILRIRLYQIARRHAEAAERLAELDLAPTAPGRTAHALGEEELIRLRNLVAAAGPADTGLACAKALADLPSLDTRQRISVGVLQASLRHRLGDHGLARRHLALALRTAQAQGLVGVLIEEGEYLERLLPLFIAEPGAGNEGLAAFARRVVTALRDLPSTALHSKAVAGISRQEYRVLLHLSDGYSNKEIARALSVSESAVKFHLRNLFRKLGVDRRGALLERARECGVLS